MKLTNYSIGDANNIQFNFSINHEITEEPCGYFEMIINNIKFGDKSIYTYLGIIEDQLVKFTKNKKNLNHEIFNNKTEKEIFNLVYLLNEDWDYSETLPIEQLCINNEFFNKFIWISEESMDNEYVFVLYESGFYKFFCKHITNKSEIQSNELFVFKINEMIFENVVTEFEKELSRY